MIRSLAPFWTHTPLQSNSTPLICLASRLSMSASNSTFCLSCAYRLFFSTAMGMSQINSSGSDMPPSITVTKLDGVNASRATRY